MKYLQKPIKDIASRHFADFHIYLYIMHGSLSKVLQKIIIMIFDIIYTNVKHYLGQKAIIKCIQNERTQSTQIPTSIQ